jgi:hypothetical protein
MKPTREIELLAEIRAGGFTRRAGADLSFGLDLVMIDQFYQKGYIVPVVKERMPPTDDGEVMFFRVLRLTVAGTAYLQSQTGYQ